MHGRKRIPIGQAADKGKDQTKTNNLKKLLSDFLRNHHERWYCCSCCCCEIMSWIGIDGSTRENSWSESSRFLLLTLVMNRLAMGWL